MRHSGICTLLVATLWLLAGSQAAAGPEPRTLLIALDAVPYRVVAEVTDPSLGEEALFQGFKGPVPLVSTFPSSTSVAMVGLLGPLGLEKSPGYEARFFDWEKRQVLGGGPISYSKIKFPWREFFDWSRRSPAGSAVEAIRPVKSGISRLQEAVDAFMAGDNDVFLIYLAATDTAVHVMSPESVKDLFKALDAMLRKAHQQQPDRPFETVILSDHGVAGGEPLENVWKPVRKALLDADFEVRRELTDADDVVLTPFGLVSNFEVYTQEENEVRVADTLVRVRGVEICAYQDGEGWSVVGDGGKAQFSRQTAAQGLLWRYRAEGSDPLEYLPLTEELSRRSPNLEGWVRDEELFEATRDGHYPDALHRIADAFELVTNPASVVCSLDPGFMFGATRTDLLAKVGKGALRWTHGALHREATLGFLLSDLEGWEPPEVARYDRCLLPFSKALGRHPNVGGGSGQ